MRPAIAHFSLAGYSDPGAIIYASRNLDPQGFPQSLASLSAAFFAGSFRNLAYPITLITSSNLGDLAKNRSSGNFDLPRPVAFGTRANLGPWLSSLALAAGANIFLFNRD